MASMDAVWEEYLATGKKSAKDKILVEYAPIVKFVALRLAVNMPKSVELDDLIGAGVIGLIKAVEKFDTKHKVKFETFASHKIRGAILDELRALDWVPRSIRAKSKDVQNAYRTLEGNLGRSPYDDEVAVELGISTSEFDSLLQEVTPTTILSLEEAMPDKGGDNKQLTLLDTIGDPNGVDPLKELGFTETKEILKVAIQELPEKEKLVVALYHYEELTLKEIGQVLNISESRVSQIHSKSIIKLRAKLLKKVSQ